MAKDREIDIRCKLQVPVLVFTSYEKASYLTLISRKELVPVTEITDQEETGWLNEKVFPVPSKHCGKVCSTEETLLKRRTEAEQYQNHPEEQDRDQLHEHHPMVGTASPSAQVTDRVTCTAISHPHGWRNRAKGDP